MIAIILAINLIPNTIKVKKINTLSIQIKATAATIKHNTSNHSKSTKNLNNLPPPCLYYNINTQPLLM